MPKKELIDYIKVEFSKGIHENRIKNTLFEVGHQIEHVEEAILHVKRKQKKRLYIMVLVIILAFLILVIGAGLLLDKGQGLRDDKANSLINDIFDDNFYYQKAIKEGNEIICESIIDLKFKNTCIENVKKTKDIKVPVFELKDRQIYKEAIENKDLGKCEEIQDSAMKNSCLQLMSKW